MNHALIIYLNLTVDEMKSECGQKKEKKSASSERGHCLIVAVLQSVIQMLQND